MTLEKTKRLGRGLEALMSPAGESSTSTPLAADNGFREIPISQIHPNPFQPRKEFNEEELSELRESLKGQGLLQPITVRPRSTAGGWELVAGERRLRAATGLGWSQIPAIVKEVDDRALLTLALVENLQRANLNPLEEAEGYQQLLEEFSLTQQQVAEAVGKNRSTVANILRLLNLPPSVRQLLREARLTLGHARALLALDDDALIGEVARRIVAKGLSVRDVERLTKTHGAGRHKNGRKRGAANRTGEVRLIEDRLRRYLQTDVSLVLSGAERGEIRIRFYSADDLDRILGLVNPVVSEAT
jgi:ParB family transcriptional regulator, chromosome partitioning protein